jgi:hypothetical protein
MTMNLHHFNPTQGPLLKEAWVNFWYVEGPVTQVANEIFLFSPGSTVQPGQRTTFKGTKSITGTGRILTLYGHRHSNCVRFAAFRVRGTQRLTLIEDWNWEEPAVLEYNSLTTNPAPDPARKTAGGFSGILEIQTGDRIEWECEVVNNRNVPITYGENEGATSEMCILVGDSVGVPLTGGLTP